jgi:hypothetical protein
VGGGFADRIVIQVGGSFTGQSIASFAKVSGLLSECKAFDGFDTHPQAAIAA